MSHDALLVESSLKLTNIAARVGYSIGAFSRACGLAAIFKKVGGKAKGEGADANGLLLDEMARPAPVASGFIMCRFG